jgi:crotonobetaine/carnitine-CoA ligase
MPAAQDCVLGALLDRHAATRPGETAAVFEDGSTWTWARARQDVQVTAGALRSLGVRPGDLVGMWLPNGKAAIRVWWAVNYLGATLVPINTAYKGPLLSHVLTDSGISVLVCHRELAPWLAATDFGGVRHLVLVGERGTPGVGIPGITVYDESMLWGTSEPFWPSGEPLTEAVPRQPWDTGTVIYTSGTTGPSKGVLVSYCQAAESVQAAYAYLTVSDRFLVNLPLFHVSGIGGVLTALSSGGSFALVTDFSTANFWDTVRQHGCTTVVLVGVMATFLLKAAPAPGDRDNPLRSVLMVPLDVDAAEFSRRFGCDVYTVFNMTEISSPLVAGPQPSPVGTCGTVRAGMTVRLVDEWDVEVPDGQVGELIVRADRPWAITEGYLNNPAATARAWRNGWFHTGDAFRRDAGGNYFFVDRMKDAIRRRGENISSFELEAVVCGHPSVREAAAVAVPSPAGEDDVLVVVSPAGGAAVDPAELLTYLVGQLPHFMVPRYVRVLADLPKTPTAKVQKHLLRAEGAVNGTYDREQHGFAVRRQRIGP